MPVKQVPLMRFQRLQNRRQREVAVRTVTHRPEVLGHGAVGRVPDHEALGERERLRLGTPADTYHRVEKGQRDHAAAQAAQDRAAAQSFTKMSAAHWPSSV
jgi:hypothetical protein